MKNYLTRAGSNDWGFGLFDAMFDDFFKPTLYRENRAMRTDVKETENGYELAIDMPGFNKQDIKLSLENGYLTVEAKREEKQETDNYIRRERSCSYSRSYYVGDAVTEEDVKAKYDNGTLSLSVPKKEKKELPKKHIEIE